MKLYFRFTGYRRLSFSLNDSADVLNICMKYRFIYRDMKIDDESVSVVCTLHTAERLTLRCAERGIAISAEPPRGLPPLVFGYRQRPGLWLGLVLAIFLVVMSGRIVWDIRVSGNETLTADEIEAVLSECGFLRGSDTSSFNTDRIEAEAMLCCDKLAWISINIKGTVAYVEVREKLPVDDTPKPSQPANVIAAHGGTVLEIIAYDGMPAVKAGDEVVEGDLLISGSYGERTPGVRVTRAAGYIKARTVRTFTMEIPYAYEEKVYTGRSIGEKYLIFFSKPIKVFVNSGNLGSTCDKIENEKYLSVFGARLPFSILSKNEYEYDTVTAYYTAEQAKSIAMERLNIISATELEDAEILSRAFYGFAGESSYILTCEIISVEDIALTRDFEFNTNY